MILQECSIRSIGIYIKKKLVFRVNMLVMQKKKTLRTVTMPLQIYFNRLFPTLSNGIQVFLWSIQWFFFF